MVCLIFQKKIPFCIFDLSKSYYMAYVHGYTDRETQRLLEQSLILEELLHEGTRYPEGRRILEVGSGVGAQTLLLDRQRLQSRAFTWCRGR